MIRFGYLGGVMQRESVGRLIPTGDTNQVSNAQYGLLIVIATLCS